MTICSSNTYWVEQGGISFLLKFCWECSSNNSGCCHQNLSNPGISQGWGIFPSEKSPCKCRQLAVLDIALCQTPTLVQSLIHNFAEDWQDKWHCKMYWALSQNPISLLNPSRSTCRSVHHERYRNLLKKVTFLNFTLSAVKPLSLQTSTQNWIVMKSDVYVGAGNFASGTLKHPLSEHKELMKNTWS